MKKEKHTSYNYQFKHTAVCVSNHPEIQSQKVAQTLLIHPFMLSRWRKQMKDRILADNDKEVRSRTEKHIIIPTQSPQTATICY